MTNTLIQDSAPAIVVCPASLKGNWAKEVACWAPAARVTILTGTKADALALRNVDYVIVNYDILAAWVDALLAAGPSALIVDESHYAKNPAAKRTTIEPLDILDDEWITDQRSSANLNDVPQYRRHNLEPDEDGIYRWTVQRHIAGRSVFKAKFLRERSPKPNESFAQRYAENWAYFISSFDDQENHLHYFLAQLPRGSKPTSFKDALEMLKPEAVKEAESQWKTVTRQGDIFAIPTDHTTKELHAPGWKTVKQGRVLNSSHVATEVIQAPGGPFARGHLYHRPERAIWRSGNDPTHKRQKIGDGKTWHRIVKNTVPADRSWSLIGSID